MAAVEERALPDTLEGAEHAHRANDVRAAASAIRALAPQAAACDIAIILGTGLGALGEAISVDASVEYADIPGFPLSTVESHRGRLLCGTLGGKRSSPCRGAFIATRDIRSSK